MPDIQRLVGTNRYGGSVYEVAVLIFPDGTNNPLWDSAGGIKSVTRTGVGKFRVTMRGRHRRLRAFYLSCGVEAPPSSEKIGVSMVLGQRTQPASGDFVYDVQVHNAADAAAIELNYAHKAAISLVLHFSDSTSKTPFDSQTPIT